MKLERRVNQLLERVFGSRGSEPTVHFHWQNLNEDHKGKPRGKPFHGRAWFNFYDREGRHKCLNVEWSVPTKSFRFLLDFERSERAVSFHFATPPVSTYVALEGLRFSEDFWKKVGLYGREIGFIIHNWTLWWKCWGQVGAWDSKTPRWQDGSFDILKALIGKETHKQEKIDSKDVLITMPEGPYQAKAEVYEHVLGRSRIPLYEQRFRTVKLDIPLGIPFSGKGENSWDCGEDATFGFSGPARSIEEGIGNIIGNVLATRRRRGDPEKWPESPEQRTVRLAQKASA